MHADPRPLEEEALAVFARGPEPDARIHLLGIGGVGMAGLALLVKSLGWRVDGCDAYPGPLLSWLAGQGIHATVGHGPEHLVPRPAALVRSPAVSWNEPELQEARRAGIPVIDRGRLLPVLLRGRRTVAVAGTHGKTTTASMIAWCLAASGQPVSYCIGGVCPGLDAVARIEPQGWIVVEADESDGTLQYYHPDVGVVTTMDLDHVDYYRDEAAMTAIYRAFAEQSGHVVLPSAGTGSCRAGFPGTAVTFGWDAADGARATGVHLEAGGSTFVAEMAGLAPLTVHLAIPGRHNVSNALAALAAVRMCGVEPEVAARALAAFRLPRRRFETVVDAAGIRVISDYAHHPVEIAALIDQALLLVPRRTLAVFQPHRFSRTRAFRSEFIDVLSRLDHVMLAPVYSASEPFVEGGTSADLQQEAERRGLTRIALSDSLESAWARLRDGLQPGDLVLIIGAGDVDKIGPWAAHHVTGLAETRNGNNV